MAYSIDNLYNYAKTTPRTLKVPGITNNGRLTEAELLYNLEAAKAAQARQAAFKPVVNPVSAKSIGQETIDPTKFAGTGSSGTGFFTPLQAWLKGINTGNSGWSLTGMPNSLGVGNTNGKAGLTIGGKNLAPISNIATAGYQGINAIKNIDENSKAEQDRQSLLSKIKSSAAGNPMLSSYLTSDQLSQLGKVKRGYYDNTGYDFDLGGTLGGIGKGALTGIAGGLPGMVIGGIGGGINSLLKSKNNTINRQLGKSKSFERTSQVRNYE